MDLANSGAHRRDCCPQESLGIEYNDGRHLSGRNITTMELILTFIFIDMVIIIMVCPYI